MNVFCRYVLVMSALVNLAYSGCRRADWWISFDKAGFSKCDSNNEYINGFWRNDVTKEDPILLLEEAECCSRPSPWIRSKNQIVYEDWWLNLDQNFRWANCPDGYFLQGLYRTGNGRGQIHNIEDGRCLKPVDHPNYHGSCYIQDIADCFNKKGLCKCNDGYFVTGLYRGDCDKLSCLGKLKCCKMAGREETLDELNKVKTRIMDTTMSDMALLAHYLGYGWCSGCRAPYVGEDFRRSGDTWKADKSGRCIDNPISLGNIDDDRLNMAYGDFSFDIKNIRFGRPVIQELTPETVDSGTIYNNAPTQATQSISRSVTSIRSVTHTTTSSWKYPNELDIEMSYTPPSVTGCVNSSVSYKFGYEKSTSTTDSSNKQQSQTFIVSTSKTLAPYTASSWRLVMSKTRSTVSYTSTIIVKFSTELQGFLRFGGGASKPGTNYHYQYRGSSDEPTVNYRFGDASTPFYTALKRQSDANSNPWLWNDMKMVYPYAQTLINDLSNENRYVFTLTGKFEDVIGKNVEFYWDADSSLFGTTVSTEDQSDPVKRLSKVAKAVPSDPAAPNPPPPQVAVDTRSSTSNPQVKTSGN